MVEVTIKNKVGLHARPAAQFCAETRKYESKIAMIKDGKEYDAKSVLMIMSAGIEYGDTIQLIATGEDSVLAEKELATLLDTMEE